MKYIITVLIISFANILYAQEFSYKSLQIGTNQGFEEGDRSFKQRKEQPGKGKKGVMGWYVMYANSLVKENSQVTNEEAHTGEYSFKLTTNASANVLYKGMLKSDPMKVKSPGRYQISYWVKTSNPKAEVKIQVFVSKDAKGVDVKKDANGKFLPLKPSKPVTEDLSLSKDWKKITKQVAVSKKDIQEGYVYISPSLLLGKTPNTTFYIDDLDVEYVMKKTSK